MINNKGYIETKTKFQILFLLLIIAVPVFLLSGWGIKKMHEFALENSSASWAPKLHLFASDVLRITLRSEKAAEGYKEFVTAFPTHELTPQAYYLVAVSYEDASKLEPAKEWYQAFIDNYPQNQLAEEAEKSLRRIKTYGR